MRGERNCDSKFSEVYRQIRENETRNSEKTNTGAFFLALFKLHFEQKTTIRECFIIMLRVERDSMKKTLESNEHYRKLRKCVEKIGKENPLPQIKVMKIWAKNIVH